MARSGTPPARRRPVRVTRSALLRGVFRRSAVAADPRIGPVGDLVLVLQDEGAPGVGLDRAGGLPDDLELTVTLDLTDHHRLREVMVGVHAARVAARRDDALAV